MTEGIILKGIGGFYYVDTPEGLIECKARGKFRKTVGKPIVGDRVQLEVQPDGTGYLMSIAPRRNSLIRPAVANLDLVVAVASAAPPVTDPFLIDKVTAIAVHKEITPLVVINKTDADAGDELYETYRKSGIEVLRVSARTGEGIDALRERICGKVSAFAGNSGVGKSTLVGALEPGLALRTGSISESHRKGRHTTTFSAMYPLTGGGFLIDTPGIKGFGLIDIDDHELWHYFPEMMRIGAGCRFYNCTHTHEPGCAVREAVARGEVARSRYESYLKIRDEDDKYRK